MSSEPIEVKTRSRELSMTVKERGTSPGALYMSPLVKQDLARLDKDGESRRSAMNSLKQFVEDLDPSSMPRFLAQVSETRDQGVSRSFAISLYEEVARVHGKLIIPYIPRVMATVTRSLSSSGGSPQLHQACAKVVSAVARHSVEEGSLAQSDKVLRDLCDPLLSVLAGKLEPLAAGAAICLQALVESEKWKYASNEVVKEACLKTSVALGEKLTRTVAHMQLARSLVTTNPSFFNNRYGVALLRTGSEVLRQTSASGTWQQRVSAARLMHAVLPIVDEATLASELEHVIHALGDCKHDRMAHVRLAVSEALKSARALSSHHNGVSGDGELSDTPHLSSLALDHTQSKKSFTELRGLIGWLEDELPFGAKQWSSLFELVEYILVYQVLAGKIFPSRNLDVNAGLSCDSRPSFCSAQAGKQVRLRPASPGFSIPHPPLLGEEMGSEQQSSDIVSSSNVTSKFGGIRSYSSLDNAAITAYKTQEGVDILVEEVSSSGTAVDTELETDMDSNQGLPSGESRYNQGGGAKDANFGLVSSIRSSHRQSSLTERSQKSVSELEGIARDRRNQFVGPHSHNVDEYLHGSSGVFVGHDSKDTLDFLSERQSRHISLLHWRSLADISRPQSRRALITAEDFLPFSTPRRLVHSLQSNSASPLGSDPPKDKAAESLHEGDVPDLETSSEAGLSVRDNSISSDNSLKSVSDADDREQQENIRKKMVINSRTKISSTELATDIAHTANCEKLSSEIARPSESLSCIGTSMFGERNCPIEDAGVLNDRKAQEFCFSRIQSRGRLLSMVGERCPAQCICSGEASKGTQFFQGEDNVTIPVQDIATILTSKSRSVLLKRFQHILREFFGKLLSVGAGIEGFLTGLLLFTLAVPFAMLMAKILRSHFDRPGLIPT